MGSQTCRNDQPHNDPVVAAIFAARHYVRPSDDLRPRTLEAAREQGVQRHYLRRLSLYAAALLMSWLVALPTARALSELRTRIVAPLPAELQQIALELSDQKRYGIDWGLVEAFEQTRSLRVLDSRANPAID